MHVGEFEGVSMDVQFSASQANTPEVLQQSDLWVDLVKHNSCAIQVEADGIIKGCGE